MGRYNNSQAPANVQVIHDFIDFYEERRLPLLPNMEQELASDYRESRELIEQQNIS